MSNLRDPFDSKWPFDAFNGAFCRPLIRPGDVDFVVEENQARILFGEFKRHEGALSSAQRKMLWTLTQPVPREVFIAYGDPPIWEPLCDKCSNRKVVKPHVVRHMQTIDPQGKWSNVVPATEADLVQYAREWSQRYATKSRAA